MVALAFLLTLLQSTRIQSTSGATLDCVPVVMAGYDVVYYHQHDTTTCGAQLGSSNYYYNLNSADEDGTLRTYQFWFSSQTNLDLFSADPWKYAPKYGGFCSYGTCCETSGTGNWPWSSTWLGPPAGPDPSRCGFRVDNGSLYFNIWSSYDTKFFQDRQSNIASADSRWKDWFGTLHAGPFNWGCFSTSGYNYMDCVNTPLDKAPKADDVTNNNYGSCDNVDVDGSSSSSSSGSSSSSSGSSGGGSSSSDPYDEDNVDKPMYVLRWIIVGLVILIAVSIVFCCVRKYGCKKEKIVKDIKRVQKKQQQRKAAKGKTVSFIELKEPEDKNDDAAEDDDDVLEIHEPNDDADTQSESILVAPPPR